MKKMSPIYLIGCLFFIFGFVTWLNATLIPYLRIACELNAFQSMFVAFAFYIAYFFLAIPSGKILERTGLKRGMTLGLLVMAVGAALFIPGALWRSYPIFLMGLFVIGAGLSLLQTAANPYAAILGPPESAARRISIMGVCNKFAGGLAPIFLGSMVLKDVDDLEAVLPSLPPAARIEQLQALAERAILPYICIVAALMLLSAFIYFSSLPDLSTESANPEDRAHQGSIWKHKNLIFGVIALFFYIGVEVIAVDTLLNYWSTLGFRFEDGLRLPMLGMVALIVGYFIGIVLMPKYLSQQKALLFSALLGVLLVLTAQITTGKISVACIVSLGLANALVWPSIWGLSIVGLGRHTQLGSSLMIMSIAGGAILPLAFGSLADHFSYQQAYWLALPCYLVIGLYAVFCIRQSRETTPIDPNPNA